MMYELSIVIDFKHNSSTSPIVSDPLAIWDSLLVVCAAFSREVRSANVSPEHPLVSYKNAGIII
jgi:hypothetical protein